MLRAARLLPVVFLTFLPGCYTSEVPLITPEIADWPLPNFVEYSEQGSEAFGNMRREESGYDRYYNATGEMPAMLAPWEHTSTVLFRLLEAPNIYIAQEYREAGEPYRYDVVRIDGETLTMMGFECDDGQETCNVATLAELEDIFRGWLDFGPAMRSPGTVYKLTGYSLRSR